MLGKPRARTAASSLSSRDLWMTGQKPLLYRRSGGSGDPGLLALRRRGSRRALTEGGRPCRTRGPAFGARLRVPAVPAQVGAGAAAIGHHLFSGQADAAQPAGFGAGLSCPVLDPPRPVSYGPLAWKSLRTGGGGGAWSRGGHRRGRDLESRVPSPGRPLRQPVAGVGCAHVMWPVGRHGQALPSVSGHLACPHARARRRGCPPAQGDGPPAPGFPGPTALRLHYGRINLR